MLEKNRDYSPANILIAGELGVIVRLWDKFCRICNLQSIPFPAMGNEIQKEKDRIVAILENNPDVPKHVLLEVEASYDDLIKKSEFDFSKYSERAPANEPLDDAYLDLANYAIIGYLKRKGFWGR